MRGDARTQAAPFALRAPGWGRESAIRQEMQRSVLIIPTYNERENVEGIYGAIVALGLDVDLMFVDDSSPDGTGDVLDRLAAADPRVSVLHRPGKLGVGGAHRDGILRAYEVGYDVVITMDCDFTHSPDDVRRLVSASPAFDLTLGSRFLSRESLPGWNPLRRALTLFGHFLTRRLLGLPWDATGALRVYRLARIPREIFERVESRGYAFFFESLFLLSRNGTSIGEVPIVLPARTYGHSKMSFREASRSLRRVVELSWTSFRDPARSLLPRTPPKLDERIVDTQGWGAYWSEREGSASFYSRVASLYRRFVLRPGLNREIRRQFPAGSRLLHAGCGSGEVDRDLATEMSLTAVDISPAALALYVRNNPRASEVRHATISALPFPDGCFDGVYNLGVMEHFEAGEIDAILAEFRRVLRPGGRLVVFWPHARGSSVLVLRAAHWVLNTLLGRGVRLHPHEATLLASREHAEGFLRRSGLEPVRFAFGPGDGFVQAVVVARRDG